MCPPNPRTLGLVNTGCSARRRGIHGSLGRTKRLSPPRSRTSSWTRHRSAEAWLRPRTSRIPAGEVTTTISGIIHFGPSLSRITGPAAWRSTSCPVWKWRTSGSNCRYGRVLRRQRQRLQVEIEVSHNPPIIACGPVCARPGECERRIPNPISLHLRSSEAKIKVYAGFPVRHHRWRNQSSRRLWAASMCCALIKAGSPPVRTALLEDSHRRGAGVRGGTRGRTALLDAVGTFVTEVGQKLSAIPHPEWQAGRVLR